MLGQEYYLPPVRCIEHLGRRPRYRDAPYWGDEYWEDWHGNPLPVNDPVDVPDDAKVDKFYPQYSIKDLVIWTEEFVYMRVAGQMEVVRMPREEALELLAPRWSEFIHKGVDDIVARRSGDTTPSCT